MDHDADVIRIVEGRGGAVKRGIIEVALRRGELPDELGKVVPVFVVADPAAFGGKVILVPPLELSLWRQRHRVPIAGHSGAFRWKESASSHSRADTGRSPYGPPSPA